MIIRDPEASDAALLAELAAAGDDLALEMAPALLGGRGRRRIAVGGDKLLGAAVAFESDWHPHWAWAHIAVRQEHRRQGVARALALDLAQARPQLKAKVRPKSAAWELTRSLGWTVLQDSEIWEVVTRSDQKRPEAVQLDAGIDEVATAFFRFYERSHQWDPIDPDKGPADIVASHIHDAAATLVVLTDGAPAAAACLWPADSGWEFSGGACRDGVTDEVALLIDAAAAWASGVPLLVEVDSDMTEVHDALRHRPKRLLDSIEIRGSEAGVR